MLNSSFCLRSRNPKKGKGLVLSCFDVYLVFFHTSIEVTVKQNVSKPVVVVLLGSFFCFAFLPGINPAVVGARSFCSSFCCRRQREVLTDASVFGVTYNLCTGSAQLFIMNTRRLSRCRFSRSLTLSHPLCLSSVYTSIAKSESTKTGSMPCYVL